MVIQAGADERLTLWEISLYLRVSQQVVRRLFDKGDLPGERDARGDWRISRERLDAWIESKKVGGPRPQPVHPATEPTYTLAELMAVMAPPEPRPLLRLADQACFVYFVQAGEHGPIKIGISARSPKSRIKSLQTAHYEELRFLGYIRGKISVEQGLHRRFAHLHIRGEWFRPAPELLAFIVTARIEKRRRR